MALVVDGQRQPKAKPMGSMVFRPVAVEPIAAPECIEVSMSMWLEADEWESTIPMDLTELKG